MEFPMKIVVFTILIIVIVLILMTIISGWTQGTQGGISEFFDFFGGVMGGQSP